METNMAADAQRRLFFQNLSTVLWEENEEHDDGTFAGGSYITPNEQGNSLLESFHVEGVGEMQLPLSQLDFARLLSVCAHAYGHGQATLVDPAVRRAWQVDASQVTFPGSPDFLTNTVRLFAKGAVRELGLDYGGILELEAHLYKLLLYEAGGHFSLHRDTEREPGMFATLVLQLPTEGGFEGGSLLVRHGGTTKTFDFSLHSATKSAHMVFYADCEHRLRRITSGTRLCLVFNLVRGNVQFDMQLGELRGFSSRLSAVESALHPWRDAMAREAPGRQGDAFPSNKLAIPLQHKYTQTNLSFSRLKGNDRVIAHVLKSCRDASGQPWLDLYLCSKDGNPYLTPIP